MHTGTLSFLSLTNVQQIPLVDTEAPGVDVSLEEAPVTDVSFPLLNSFSMQFP